MFHVGQKVVCVDDTDYPMEHKLGAGYARGLRKGAVYTIASIRSTPTNVFLRIAELDNNGWSSVRFRPAVERKTDISIFKELLNNPHKQLEGV